MTDSRYSNPPATYRTIRDSSNIFARTDHGLQCDPENPAAYKLVEDHILVGSWRGTGLSGHYVTDVPGTQSLRFDLQSGEMQSKSSVPNIEKVYVSKRQPWNNSSYLYRVLKNHPEVYAFGRHLLAEQTSESACKNSITIADCLFHRKPNISSEDVVQWTAKQEGSQLVRDHDISPTEGDNIVAEGSVVLHMTLYWPRGRLDRFDMDDEDPRYGPDPPFDENETYGVDC
jgi:hypothetical protein